MMNMVPKKKENLHLPDVKVVLVTIMTVSAKARPVRVGDHTQGYSVQKAAADGRS